MPIPPLYGSPPGFNFTTGPAATSIPAGGGGGSVPSLTGATPTGYSAPYGGIPQVPSLIDIYGQANAANQSFLPSLTGLQGTITGATEADLLNNLRMAIPGYDTSVAKSMGNISQLQAGQIPSDVKNLITQQAAERGIATGLYDSPNANAALLRALGLTSLGLEGEGEKQMTALVGRTPQAQPFDISKLLMSPTDLYEAQLLANLYRAAPVPSAAAGQMLGNQLLGYALGKGNIPPYSAGLTPGTPYQPIVRGDVGPGAWAGPGATGSGGPDVLAGTSGDVYGWVWDPTMGAYYNPTTGEYADTQAQSSSTVPMSPSNTSLEDYWSSVLGNPTGEQTPPSPDDIAMAAYGADTGEGP